MRKRVVTIGGGSGSFNLLKGLKKYAMRQDDEDDSIDIKFIAASTDSGGSSGILRDEEGILPPGDMRRGFEALARSKLLRDLFRERCDNSDGSLNGHSFGNLFIAKLIKLCGGDEKRAYDEVHNLLNVAGRVIPSTWNDVHICAEYEDGTIKIGEHEIDKFENPNNARIERLYLNQKAEANPEALEAIANADAVIIGPGDLYTSIICNFLAEGIIEAIRDSKALKIYNCNIMTKPSETPDYTVGEHFNDIEKYLGEGVIDIVTHNSRFDLDSILLGKYEGERKYPVKLTIGNFKGKKLRLIAEDLAGSYDIIRHDSEKISKLMMGLIFNEAGKIGKDSEKSAVSYKENS